jgi:hypothetical protein
MQILRISAWNKSLQALVVIHGIAESDQQMVQFALSVNCEAVI